MKEGNNCGIKAFFHNFLCKEKNHQWRSCVLLVYILGYYGSRGIGNGGISAAQVILARIRYGAHHICLSSSCNEKVPVEEIFRLRQINMPVDMPTKSEGRRRMNFRSRDESVGAPVFSWDSPR